MSGTTSDLSQYVDLTRQAVETGDRFSIARLISLFEDARPLALERRSAVMKHLGNSGLSRKASIVGITGTPGAGKSTLVGRLALELVAADPLCRVAVLAVDPSSTISGGALLGDRTRVRFPPDEPRLYFRSQSTDRELGGLSRSTFAVCRLLYHLFDYIMIETVGIGQNEIEVNRLADRTYLILQPLAGDQVQFMKAGIMEMPQAFVINKCDQGEVAQKTYHSLKASLDFVRPGEDALPIFRVSALNGTGVDDLVTDMRAFRLHSAETAMQSREAYYLDKWVRDEFGRRGLLYLQETGGASAWMHRSGDFDSAIRLFSDEYLTGLRPEPQQIH